MQAIFIHDTDSEEIMGLVTPLQNVNMDTFWDEVHSTWSKFNDEGLTEDYTIEDFVDFHNENSTLKIDNVVTDFIQL